MRNRTKGSTLPVHEGTHPPGHSLTTRASRVALITYAYPQDEMEGPPFALHDEDVKRFFSDGFEVEHLEGMELEDERGRGLSSITLSVFKITRI